MSDYKGFIDYLNKTLLFRLGYVPVSSSVQERFKLKRTALKAIAIGGYLKRRENAKGAYEYKKTAVFYALTEDVLKELVRDSQKGVYHTQHFYKSFKLKGMKTTNIEKVQITKMFKNYKDDF